MIEPIAGEHRPVALWVSLAAVGTVAVIAAAYLALAAGRDVAVRSDAGDAAAPSTAVPTAAVAAPATTATAAPATAAPSGAVPSAAAPSTASLASPVPASPATVPTAGQPAADCPPVFEVRFGRNSADADPAAVSQPASGLVAWLSTHPAVAAVVNGHSDASGTEAGNLELSYRRATTVAYALTGGGLPADRVQARGYGEYQPMVGEPPDSAGNRRATVSVPGYESCPLVATITGGAS